jgi:hypothetical protein
MARGYAIGHAQILERPSSPLDRIDWNQAKSKPNDGSRVQTDHMLFARLGNIGCNGLAAPD